MNWLVWLLVWLLVLLNDHDQMLQLPQFNAFNGWKYWLKWAINRLWGDCGCNYATMGSEV